jgi:hypothetical protein
MKWFHKDYIVVGLLVCAIIACYRFYNRPPTCGHVVKYNINYIAEAELKYFETKSKLVTEIQNYMVSVAPTTNLHALDIVDLCQKYTVDVKFVLAQAEIESSFGTKGLASKTRSVFNLGAFDNLSYSEIRSQYKYMHPNASIEPYLKLLNERYLVDKLESDLMLNYVDKNGTRYASDELYEEKLRNKYQYIKKNTDIDSLESLLIHYAIKCNR